jgi:hypothetical protein
MSQSARGYHATKLNYVIGFSQPTEAKLFVQNFQSKFFLWKVHCLDLKTYKKEAFI